MTHLNSRHYHLLRTSVYDHVVRRWLHSSGAAKARTGGGPLSWATSTFKELTSYLKKSQSPSRSALREYENRVSKFYEPRTPKNEAKPESSVSCAESSRTEEPVLKDSLFRRFIAHFTDKSSSVTHVSFQDSQPKQETVYSTRPPLPVEQRAPKPDRPHKRETKVALDSSTEVSFEKPGSRKSKRSISTPVKIHKIKRKHSRESIKGPQKQRRETKALSGQKLSLAFSICALCKAGHLQEALSALNRLRDSGKRPTIHPYACVISALDKSSNTREISRRVSEAKDFGLLSLALGDGAMDLHGLSGAMARAVVQFRLDEWRNGSLEPCNLAIITGRGKHSPGGIAVLPTEVRAFLRDMDGPQYIEFSDNPGRFYLTATDVKAWLERIKK